MHVVQFESDKILVHQELRTEEALDEEKGEEPGRDFGECRYRHDVEFEVLCEECRRKIVENQNTPFGRYVSMHLSGTLSTW